MAPDKEASQVTEALRELGKARRAAVELEIEALKRENAWLQASAELLPLKYELARLKLQRAEDELTRWQEAASARRESEVDRAIRLAKAAVKAAPEPLKPLARANLETAKARRETEEKLRSANAKQEELKKTLEELGQQFDRVQKEAGSRSAITESVGAVLRQQRNELPDVEALARAIQERQSKLYDLRLRLFQMREEQEQLANLDEAVESTIGELGLDEDRRDTVRTLLAARQELLDGLTTDSNALLQALPELDKTESELVVLSESYGTFIDERVLWIRSTPSITLKDFQDAFKVVRALFRWQAWSPLPSAILSQFREEPILPVLTLVVVFSMLMLGVRLRKQIRLLGERAETGSCRDFSLTLWASLLTVIISIAWPGLMYVAGVWLRSESQRFPDLLGPLSSGLIAASAVYFPLEVWRQASRTKGLMQSHFGATTRSLQIVRRNLRWLIVMLVPLVGVTAAIYTYNHPLYQRSVGRLAFVGAMAALSVFVMRVGHPSRGPAQAYFARRTNSFLYRTRWIWFAGLLAIPLGLTLLCLTGYQYTALQLATRLQGTVFLVLALWLLYALGLRWVVLSRRRLAIEQARARLAEGSEQVDTGPGSLEAAAGIQQIDLQSVDQQTRRLIRVVTIVFGGVALWSLWVDVLPALSVVGEGTAWETEVTAVAPSGGGDGTEAGSAAATKIASVSYADVFVAILIMTGTLIATRDIPGLLELVLLQRLPMEASLRFAITTLTRYAIFVFGVVWALGTISIGWSKVQWLVAAVSLGLGFGLQEIFANFVSGLIILFERPLRSGDIVTIDNVTGVVKSIRMRATTIQDWDRKDLIVPNKDFITGRVLNWTLSDEVSRIVLPVGVAYGSNTELAKSLVLAAAQNHPLITSDPAPSVTFEEFGESSLNLILRCFISLKSMPQRLKIVDDLHTTIDRSFRDSGIEIPFPQRDLHVRSVDASIANFSSQQVESNGSHGSPPKSAPRDG